MEVRDAQTVLIFLLLAFVPWFLNGMRPSWLSSEPLLDGTRS
jgi:hypothetical protein